jgi:hypothetical protein
VLETATRQIVAIYTYRDVLINAEKEESPERLGSHL